MGSARTINGSDEVIREMAHGLAEGTVVPFLGAGVNACGRPAQFKWRFGTPYLPVGSELSSYLAHVGRYPKKDGGNKNLLRVAQYISTKRGYGRLRDELRKILNQDYEPTAVHRFFARLPKLFRDKHYGRGIKNFQLLIVTTNYDDLLERAFRDAGVPFDLLVYRAEGNRGRFCHVKPNGDVVRIPEPNEYTDLSLDVRPVIVKIHGALDRARPAGDSYVISEDDYIDYLAGADLSNFLPAVIKEELINSQFLFLGYSLQDWNLRVFLKRIWEDQQKFTYNSWAIQLHPQVIDRELWRSRKVDIIGMSLDDYVVQLQSEMDALPEHEPGPDA
jgi:hypothetical protein